MANYFDQFDAAQEPQSGSFFDQFDGKNDPGFVTTIKRTGGQMAESMARSAEDVFGKNPITQGIQDWGQGVQARNPAGIGSLSDIAENPLLTVKEGVGNMVAQMPATLASGAAGQFIGGALGAPFGPAGIAAGQFLGRWGGALVPTFMQEYGGIRKEQDDQGIDDKGRALAAAIPATAIEFNPLSPDAGMIRLLGKEAGKELFAKSGKEIAKDLGKAAVKGAIAEGPMEEFPQTLLEAWGAHKDPLSAETMEEGAVASILAAIGGGAMGPVTATMSGLKYARAQKEQEAADKKAAEEAAKNPMIAGLLPAPTSTGTPSDQILTADVERQNAVDAAQASADTLYAERAAYEAAMAKIYPYGQPTVTGDVNGLQQQIDALLGIDQTMLKGIQRTHYVNALTKLLAEPIGIGHDENGLERPVTMGEYLDNQVAAEQMARNREFRQAATEQAQTRLEQLASEENPMAMPDIPVVGPLSAAANTAVQTGAVAQEQAKQAMAAAAEAAGNQNTVKNESSANPLTAAAEATAAMPQAAGIPGQAPNIKAQAPNIEGTPNAAQTQQVAQETPQANAPQVGAATTAAPAAPAGEGTGAGGTAQGIDLTGRTEQQLQWLTQHGINGHKEAAVAELQRRGTAKAADSANVPAQNAADSAKTKESKVYYRDDNGVLWGIPYDMREGQQPKDIKAEFRQDWVQLSGANFYGNAELGKAETEADEARLNPGEWNTVDSIRKAKQQPAADVTPTNEGDTTQAAETKAEKPAVDDAEAIYRPLIEQLIRNKRNAKQLGFDIDGAIAKAKDAWHGKKQMPGAFRSLADKAEKLGDKETAGVLRQIADLNDARKNKKPDAAPGQGAQQQTTKGAENGQAETEVLKQDAGQGTTKAGEAAQTSMTKEQIDAAAHEAATSPNNDTPQPTDAQIEAGNYKKGHVAIHGLDIAIENPEGSTRSGTDEDGKAWQTTMQSHYGYIKRTEGNDGDHVDVFIGKNPDSAKVFIVDQKNAKTGAFDEHKVLLGFDNLLQAKAAYAKNYEKGWMAKGVMSVSETSIDAFKEWLKTGDLTKPFAPAEAPAAELPQNFNPDVQYAKRPDGSYKTKGEYTPEEWSAYTKSVIVLKLKSQDKAPAIDKKAVAKATKTYERELHVSAMADAGLLEAAGTLDIAAFTPAAEKAVVKRIEELTKDAETPEQKAALAAMVADGKPVLPASFFEAAHASLKKQWEIQQKEAARDPEQYKETLRWGMAAKKIAEGSDDAVKYKTGFDHALRGQTKSTLPNDSAVYLDGYKDARAWMGTEEGRAWYDGKRIEKEKNTGVVLKRWWDKAKKSIEEMTATDGKAWENLLKLTSRAELFPATVAAEDATPGAKQIIESLRAKVATFQEFFWKEGVDQTSWGRGRYSYGPKELFMGNHSSYRGRFADGLNKDDAKRLQLSKDIATEYQEKLAAFAGEFKDVKTLDDIEAVVNRLFYPQGRLDENGKMREWHQSEYAKANYSLFAANPGDIQAILGMFERDSWDAKYKAWTKARATENEKRDEGNSNRKDSIARPRLDKIMRVGMPAERGQRNITAQEFKKTFGFADVVIGNWVKARDAQDHLNYAYDALISLATMLGAKPHQLSFGGKLYFTIGALGHGKYAAHFQRAHPVEINGVPTTVPVINVTATRGDGSVLHEFFHAIDFMNTDPALQKAIRSVKKMLVYEAPTPAMAERVAADFLVGGSYFPHLGKNRTSAKDHALYALKTYYYGERKLRKTDFIKEAELLDKGSKEPYWSNDAEPFARMSEAWGYDALTNDAKRDDYLVSDYAKEGKYKRPSHRGAPYPMGTERQRLAELFQKFIEQVEWTDEGPKLKADSPWQTEAPWDAAMNAYKAALSHIADNIDAFQKDLIARRQQQQEERERQKEEAIFGTKEEAAPPAAEEPAPPSANAAPEADNVGMSEDELSAIFDEEAAALREETQEQPAAEEPGEKITTPKDKWTREDIEFVLSELEAGRMVLVADAAFGLPTIHDMPNGRHMGMGVFSASGDGWEATFTAGGGMYSTPGGNSYTTLSASRGTVPASVYDLDAAKAKLKGKLLAKAGPRAAPSLSAEQDKTAGELAKEMAKYGVQGIDEALKGLVSIFGGGKGKLMSFPGGFDEDSYNAAKPHFKAAAEAFNKAGLAFKDFVRIFFRSIIQQFGDGVKPYAIRFAKEYEAELLAKSQQQAQPAAEPNAPTTAAPAARVADWVFSKLDDGEYITWQQLFEKADESYGGTQANGIYTVKDAYDALELGINKYLLALKDKVKLDASPAEARKAIKELDDMLNQVPTQTKRTQEQDEFQQFSTPPHYAYLANWVANLRSTDSYLEPSAGIGGLAVFGKMAGVKEITVNEFSPRRLSILQNMPFDRFHSENAEQLNNILPDDVQPSVIVMNPPFSATAGRMAGSRDTMNGAKHIEQALKRLQSNGRLVAIVGEGMAADRPAFRDWWKKIMAEYNVRANVGIEGAGYVKYGTTFDNQILVIDKTGPTTAEVITGKVKTPLDALNLLENVRDTRPFATANQAANGLDSQAPGQPGSGTPAGNGGQQQSGTDAGTDSTVGVGTGRGGKPGAGLAADGKQASGNGATASGRGVGRGGNKSAESGQPGNGNAGGTNQSGNAASGSSGNAETSAVKLGESAAAADATGAIGNSVFEQYQPKKVRIEGAVPHNTPLVESSALASVVPPDPVYVPNLPANVIKKGLLSDAQLEAIVYAGQAHEQMLPDGKTRRGFFLGDGTGVGKGRQISGVIMDNLRQGRKKAIWISKKKELVVDAKRDYSDIGGDAARFIELGKKKLGDKLTEAEGILFAGYPNIRSTSKAAREATKANRGKRQSNNGISYERVQQIVDWVGEDFDGVLVFDEAHEMGNAVPMKGKRGTSEPSDQALACLELQRALPKARVMYVSATGATEVSNLAYAERLGIWGEGTPFANVTNFVAEMSRSVSAMELVAQNLKQLGLYLARSLSFDGVQYSRLEHTLTDYQRETYDLLAGAWQNVLQNIDAALEKTGVMEDGKAKGRESGKVKSAVLSAFWGNHQRFFNQIITAAQMPTVLRQIREDLDSGKSVVLQITNTNEADQTRALAKLKKNEDGSEDIEEELDLTPRDQLINFVTNSFPVMQFESYTDGEATRIRAVVDSEGKPVVNKEALAQRDELIRALKNIQVPDSPLQMLINEFGPEAVAEITGRTQRVVPTKDGKFKVEKRGPAAVFADSEAFKNGKKHILIFSQAGGTGFSFHADRRYKNQQQRVHYVLQPGWSADKAVQGFGRSHRTNQASSPIYRLVSTDIPAQKRFISSIARRLEQLGALTAGQRDTAGGSMFSATDNLESRYATAAVRQFFEAIRPGRSIEGLPADILDQMGLKGIYAEDTGQINDTKLPPVTQFLNRLLSLRLDSQGVVFDYFIKTLESQIEIAKRDGSFDDGLQTIRHEGAQALTEQDVYEDKMTGAKTRYVEVEYKVKNPIFSFDIANNGARQGGWFKNKHSGRVAAIWPTGMTRTDKDGRMQKIYGFWRTSGSSYDLQSAFKVDGWEKLTEAEAKALWEAENAERPLTIAKRLHMVVGGILPIWDRFNNENVSVVRLGLDDNRRLLGRQIADKDLSDTMQRLDVQSAAARMTGAELVAAVMRGDKVEMSNRMTLKRSKVSGENRVELAMRNPWMDSRVEANLRAAGLIGERIEYRPRWFVPNSKEAGGKVLDEVMRILGMNAVSVGSEQQDSDGLAAGNVATGSLTAADRAIYGMAVEGKSVADILGLIAKVSRNPMNRQLAKLLMKTGINPTVTVGDGTGWKFNAGEGNKYAAGYNPKTDTVALFRPASAERNMLHELMHAATLKALKKGGLASGQLKALYNHVKATKKLDGMYGMADIDEFIAEAFTNPRFQQKLKGVGAPTHAGTLKSAWHWFVRVVRGILGIKANEENALSRALELGVEVMRDNMRLANAQQDAAIRYNLTEEASNQLHDLFKNQNTFNWLHKSVSTQYHKATVDKDFKRVFDLGQKYLLDVSRFAMDAADRAPHILQKLGSIRDLFTQGAKKADIEAISNPVFTGTLENTVYTDAELRSRFNLTDQQRDLYREFRDAINKSLDDLGVSEMARISKSILPAALIEQAKASDLNTAAELLSSALLDDMQQKIYEGSAAREAGDDAKAEELERKALLSEKTAGDVQNKAKRINQLKDMGYAPLTRFGQHAVDVVETDPISGEEQRVYFGMYETQREANAAARALKSEYPNATVTQGPMDTESWKLFGGIDPSSLEVFAEAVGADESSVFQDYLRLTQNNRSALKRLIKREGIAGFSKDSQRVLAQFVTSNGRLAAKNYHFGDMKSAVMDIPKMKGDVRNEAAKLVDYLQNPNEEAAPLRGYLFVHFLGGSIASALVNMTQPLTMTAPYLAQFGGAVKAGKALADAAKLYASGNYDPQLAEAMKLAEREGITAPHEIHQLYAESMRGLGRNIAVRKLLRGWGGFFSLAEAFNRHLTFIAAYNMARDNGEADPFAFAQNAVESTQGIYNKGNRPDWARGTIGATVFTFKQFSIAYIEFLRRLQKNNPQAFYLALAIMFIGAGAEGMPFADDLMDLIDTIGQFFGFTTNSKQWLRKNAAKVFGETGGDIFRKGVSGIPGMPLDISSRVGVSNLIPGTALFKVSETNKARDIFEFVGPIGGFADSAVKGFEAARTGNVAGAVRLAAPLAVQNIAKGADMVHYGFYRDQQGRKVVDTDGWDAFIKTIGFNPNVVARESAKIREQQQNINQQKAIESEIADRWAAGLFEKDPEKVKQAQDELREWNARNPDAKILITPQQISTRLKAMTSTREERFIKSAPKEMRGTVREELSR